MTDSSLEKLSPEVEEEMRAIALEYFCDLWENIEADGLDPMIVAETIMEAALNEMAGLKGEDLPGRMLSSLVAKDEHGAFTPFRTLQ